LIFSQMGVYITGNEALLPSCRLLN
jgi:hypothetical protein